MSVVGRILPGGFGITITTTVLDFTNLILIGAVHPQTYFLPIMLASAISTAVSVLVCAVAIVIEVHSWSDRTTTFPYEAERRWLLNGQLQLSLCTAHALLTGVLSGTLVADLVTELRTKHQFVCPSPRCDAYYLAFAISRILLLIYITQILAFGLVLYEIRSAPRSINRERSYRAILNREITQLLSLRQQGAEARSPGLETLRTRYGNAGDTDYFGNSSEFGTVMELSGVRAQRHSESSLTSFTPRDDMGFARKRGRTVSADIGRLGVGGGRRTDEVTPRRVTTPTATTTLAPSPRPFLSASDGVSETRTGRLTPAEVVSMVFSDQFGLGTPSRSENITPVPRRVSPVYSDQFALGTPGRSSDTSPVPPRSTTPTLRVTCPSDEGDTPPAVETPSMALGENNEKPAKAESDHVDLTSPPSPGFSMHTERNRYWVRARPGTPRHARDGQGERPESPDSRYSRISNLPAEGEGAVERVERMGLGASSVKRDEADEAEGDEDGTEDDEDTQATPVGRRISLLDALRSPETPGDDTLETPRQ